MSNDFTQQIIEEFRANGGRVGVLSREPGCSC
jgi:hypothetical protein